MKNLFTVLLLSLLVGCTQLPPAQEPSTQQEFPEAQLVRCDQIPVPDNEETGYANVTLGDLIKYSTGLQTQYNECAIRHDSLVNLIENENKKIRAKNQK